MEAQKQILEFLKDNPESSKASISTATGFNGLYLFNQLKKLQVDGYVSSEGHGPEMKYSITEKEFEEDTDHEENETSSVVRLKPGRDNSKLTFNDTAYGKGPLVQAVVAKYVESNPSISYQELKDIFPDKLLKKFGIFQKEDEAKTIGGKGDRYFSQEERKIKLKDAMIVVCNQFTLENIQPFLKAARELGYEII